MRHAFMRVMSRPSNMTVPDDAATRPVATRASVVLPAPFAPSSATTLRSATEIDTPNTARNGP